MMSRQIGIAGMLLLAVGIFAGAGMEDAALSGYMTKSLTVQENKNEEKIPEIKVPEIKVPEFKKEDVYGDSEKMAVI